jgi:hypothetical protein
MKYELLQAHIAHTPVRIDDLEFGLEVQTHTKKAQDLPIDTGSLSYQIIVNNDVYMLTAEDLDVCSNLITKPHRFS